MSRSERVTGLCLIVLLGLWGCARQDNGAAARRAKALDDKCSRLESDFRAACASRDQFRQRLAGAEEAGAKLEQELRQLREQLRAQEAYREQVAALTGRVEDLTAQLRQRTQERDALQERFEGFRNTLRAQLEQVEAALNPGIPADTFTAIPAAAPTTLDARPEEAAVSPQNLLRGF